MLTLCFSSDQAVTHKTKDGSKSLRGKKASCHEVNPLDRTCVHPESYVLAHKYDKSNVFTFSILTLKS